MHVGVSTIPERASFPSAQAEFLDLYKANRAEVSMSDSQDMTNLLENGLAAPVKAPPWMPIADKSSGWSWEPSGKVTNYHYISYLRAKICIKMAKQ